MEELFLQDNVKLDYYKPLIKANDIAVIIFPGGAYNRLARHEGEGYAQLFNTFGITAFVLNYRVFPNRFPCPLIDARNSVRFVRSQAKNLEINPDKIIVVGSSAGGHLAALLSTFKDTLEGDSQEANITDFIPDGQILCYPVISSDESISHRYSFENVLGNNYSCLKDKISPELLVTKDTPKAFIWHNADDSGVSVMNSIRYFNALLENSVPCELHVFPQGDHGVGIAPNNLSVFQWTMLAHNWLQNNFIWKL